MVLASQNKAAVAEAVPARPSSLPQKPSFSVVVPFNIDPCLMNLFVKRSASFFLHFFFVRGDFRFFADKCHVDVAYPKTCFPVIKCSDLGQQLQAVNVLV